MRLLIVELDTQVHIIIENLFVKRSDLVRKRNHLPVLSMFKHVYRSNLDNVDG